MKDDGAEAGAVWFLFCLFLGALVTAGSLLSKMAGVEVLIDYSWGQMFWPLGIGGLAGLSPLLLFILIHTHD